MKKNIKLYVIAVISVVFLGALVVHFDDIREYKQECEEYMDDAYEARTERMQSILKEELEKEAYKNEAYEMIKKEYGIMPLTFGYLPAGLRFKSIEFLEEKEYAVLRYEAEDDKWIELYVLDPHRSKHEGGVAEVSGESQASYRVDADDVSVQVEQFKDNVSEKTRMFSPFVVNDVRYEILSHNIEPVEYDKVIENLVFDNSDK